MSDSRMMVIAALVLFAVAALCAFISHRRRNRIAASATWPKAKGTVLSNDIKTINAGMGGGEISLTYSINLRYRYAVAGADYESNRIGWGTKSADRAPDIPQAFVRDFPAGHAIDVFYDPTSPARAMIDPTGSRFGLVHVNLARVMAWTLGFCGLLALGASALS